ncbi:MAG: lytic murein transglycosylase B [Chromatiales bacterium]
MSRVARALRRTRPAGLAALLASALTVACPALGAPPSYDAGRHAFIEEMVRSHGFDAPELEALMSDARYRPRIVDAMDRPYEAKPWREYRRLFVTPERIDGGVAFLRANRTLLDRAQAAYGVPAEIVVAIVGVETNYGRNLGDHRVIDALSTLGFSYPRRATFFRGELEEFLLLSRDEGVDPRTARGSYAGAVGKPQFIPSSYRAYAVDFDEDGRRDLWDSNADVIGSVGNYLARHGWRRDEPVALRAVLNGEPHPGIEIAGKDPQRPETTLARLAAAGIRADPEVIKATPPDGDSRAALIALDGDGPEYWLGFDNFYAITRYNHSNLYAMAVFQLSRAIARTDQQQQGG